MHTLVIACCRLECVVCCNLTLHDSIKYHAIHVCIICASCYNTTFTGRLLFAICQHRYCCKGPSLQARHGLSLMHQCSQLCEARGLLVCRNWRAVATHVGSRTQKAAKAQVKLLQAGRVAAESRPSQHNTLMEGALPSTGPLEASPDQVCTIKAVCDIAPGLAVQACVYCQTCRLSHALCGLV